MRKEPVWDKFRKNRKNKIFNLDFGWFPFVNLSIVINVRNVARIRAEIEKFAIYTDKSNKL